MLSTYLLILSSLYSFGWAATADLVDCSAVLQAGTSSTQCPSECTSCLGNTLWCVETTDRIFRVPSSFQCYPWVEDLNLSGNRIQKIGAKDFVQLINVVQLVLSSNLITQIHPDALDTMPKLHKLRLDNNRLTEMPRIGFSPTLTLLNLANNKISDINVQVLAALPKLTKLVLNGNSINLLKRNSFPPGTNIRVLYLGFNNMRAIETGSTGPLRRLEHIRLNRNKLEKLTREMFKNNSNLLSLDLHNNKLRTMEALTFKGLAKLRDLSLQDNQIANLTDGVFYGLEKLTILNLGFNQIKVVDKSWLIGLDSLQKLILSNNKITRIETGGWSPLKELTYLDLAHNMLTVIPKGLFSDLSQLMELNLDHNHITNIADGAFVGLQQLGKLGLNFNQLSWDNNQDGAVDLFDGLKTLNTLQLNNNKIKSIAKRSFDGLEELQFLNLSNNAISHIDYQLFEALPKLKTLILNSKDLVCDCSLQSLPVRLTPYSSYVQTATCSEPQSLRGRKIVSIEVADFKCKGANRVRNDTLIVEPIDKEQMALKHLNHTINCTFISSVKDGIVISWKKDNKVLTDGRKYMIRRSAAERSPSPTSSYIFKTSLNIMSMSDRDSGTYSCVGSITKPRNGGKIRPLNYIKRVKKETIISVGVAPKFTTPPKNQTVTAGSKAAIQCCAYGEPRPEISMQSDAGERFPAAVERRVTFDLNVPRSGCSTFYIDVRLIDSGMYSCTAKNKAGSSVVNASITVRDRPRFVSPTFKESPSLARGSLGAPFFIECKATGGPLPVIQWYKDGRPVYTDFSANSRYRLYENNTELLIRKLALSDRGTILKCIASNLLGTIQQSMNLTVVAGVLPRRTGDGGGSMSGASPGGADGQTDGTNEQTTLAIIVISVVACVVITSFVWVIIIYRIRHNKFHDGSGGSGGGGGGSSCAGLSSRHRHSSVTSSFRSDRDDDSMAAHSGGGGLGGPAAGKLISCEMDYLCTYENLMNSSTTGSGGGGGGSRSRAAGPALSTSSRGGGACTMTGSCSDLTSNTTGFSLIFPPDHDSDRPPQLRRDPYSTPADLVIRASPSRFFQPSSTAAATGERGATNGSSSAAGLPSSASTSSSYYLPSLSHQAASTATPAYASSPFYRPPGAILPPDYVSGHAGASAPYFSQMIHFPIELIPPPPDYETAAAEAGPSASSYLLSKQHSNPRDKNSHRSGGRFKRSLPNIAAASAAARSGGFRAAATRGRGHINNPSDDMILYGTGGANGAAAASSVAAAGLTPSRRPLLHHRDDSMSSSLYGVASSAFIDKSEELVTPTTRISQYNRPYHHSYSRSSTSGSGSTSTHKSRSNHSTPVKTLFSNDETGDGGEEKSLLPPPQPSHNYLYGQSSNVSSSSSFQRGSSIHSSLRDPSGPPYHHQQQQQQSVIHQRGEEPSSSSWRRQHRRPLHSSQPKINQQQQQQLQLHRQQQQQHEIGKGRDGDGGVTSLHQPFPYSTPSVVPPPPQTLTHSETIGEMRDLQRRRQKELEEITASYHLRQSTSQEEPPPTPLHLTSQLLPNEVSSSSSSFPIQSGHDQQNSSDAGTQSHQPLPNLAAAAVVAAPVPQRALHHQNSSHSSFHRLVAPSAEADLSAATRPAAYTCSSGDTTNRGQTAEEQVALIDDDDVRSEAQSRERLLILNRSTSYSSSDESHDDDSDAATATSNLILHQNKSSVPLTSHDRSNVAANITNITRDLNNVTRELNDVITRDLLLNPSSSCPAYDLTTSDSNHVPLKTCAATAASRAPGLAVAAGVAPGPVLPTDNRRLTHNCQSNIAYLPSSSSAPFSAFVTNNNADALPITSTSSIFTSSSPNKSVIATKDGVHALQYSGLTNVASVKPPPPSRRLMSTFKDELSPVPLKRSENQNCVTYVS